MKIHLLLAALAIVICAPACTNQSGQINDLVAIDQEKSELYANVATSFDSFLGAIIDATDATSAAGAERKKKFQDVRATLRASNEAYSKLTRAQIEALLSMKTMSPQEREQAVLDLIAIIGAIKGD